MSELRVDDVRMVSARQRDRERGLLGWVSCTLNGAVLLSGLALRRTLRGNLALSFPARRDSHGRDHFFIKPLNDVSRREIEHQVFEALGLEEGATQ